MIRGPRLVAALAAPLLVAALACSAGGDLAEVITVHDGDTVTVLRGREQTRVRLACIDAPEQGQAFGTRARQHLRELVLRRRVAVVAIDRDDYGRTVARLLLDGEDVNLAMVRAGLAWHYRHHCPGDAALAAAEAEARAARRGLWTDAQPLPPWTWRRQK